MEYAFITLVISLFSAFSIFIYRVLPLSLGRIILAILGVWLILQATLAGSGYFRNLDSIPPRIALVVFPSLVLLVFLAIKLAAPTPFQVFHTEPPNTLIAEFPWIWLPGFVVPMALAAHILSIRQLRYRGRP